MAKPLRDVVRELETSLGLARVTYSSPPKASVRAQLFIGHGAGGGIDAPDLARVARRGAELGIRVARVEQPYRVAGRRLNSHAGQLDQAFREIVGAERLPRVSLFVGGRSAGARVACRTASSLDASGVVALAFPLHPPDQPHKSRLPELLGAGVPTLILQGTRDAFGTPEEFPPGLLLTRVEEGDHSFEAPRSSGRTSADLCREVAEKVCEFVLEAAGSTDRERLL